MTTVEVRKLEQEYPPAPRPKKRKPTRLMNHWFEKKMKKSRLLSASTCWPFLRLQFPEILGLSSSNRVN